MVKKSTAQTRASNPAPTPKHRFLSLTVHANILESKFLH